MSVSDDALIMRGLLYDQYQSYENSRQIYARLFDKTEEEVYLFKEAKASLMGKTHMLHSIDRLKSWDNKHAEDLEVTRLLIPLYLSSNQFKFAKYQAEALIERSTKPVDLELASGPFLYMGEFTRALDLLKKVYTAQPTERILLGMTDIMDEYTHERTQAIQLLETYIRMHDYSTLALTKLLVLYTEEKNIDGLISTYKLLYLATQDKSIISKMIDIYAYKRDIDGATAFLEEVGEGDEILYELYKNKQAYDKALVVLDKCYAQDKDPRWFAEKGILIFESAKNYDDQKILNEVISLFDEAIKQGVDDSIYLNYYGYTLIDREIDIDKGIQIIKNALDQQPHNTYYLDSLAWGYYKKHECTKAYREMKKVVDEEGLEQEEIKAHWDAIKQCK